MSVLKQSNVTNILPQIWKYSISVDGNESIQFPYTFEENILIESKFQHCKRSKQDIVFYLNEERQKRKIAFKKNTKIKYQETIENGSSVFYTIYRITTFKSNIVRLDFDHKTGFIDTKYPQKTEEIPFQFSDIKFDLNLLQNGLKLKFEIDPHSLSPINIKPVIDDHCDDERNKTNSAEQIGFRRNENENWDHYYMDLVFKGVIARWSVDSNGKRRGGFINIYGEDPHRQIPFRIENINNYHLMDTYYKSDDNIDIPIKCQIGNNGEQFAKNITISAPYHAHNDTDTECNLFRGIIKMIPTQSVYGIIFCEKLDEAVRFKYCIYKSVILEEEQEVYFNYNKVYDHDNVRHIARNVIATASISISEIRRKCLTKTGESHLNSAYFIQNTEINIRENRFYEFKHFKSKRMDVKYGNGVKQMIAVIIKNMNAFMNTNGGILFIGIEDNGRIKGIQNVTRYAEDKMRISISHCMRSWQPKIIHNLSYLTQAYNIEFIDVIRIEKCHHDSKGNGTKGYILPNTKVIMITVRPIFTKKIQIIFRTGESHFRKTFMRNDATVSECEYRRNPRFCNYNHYKSNKSNIYVSNDGELPFNVRNNKKMKEMESDIEDETKSVAVDMYTNYKMERNECLSVLNDKTELNKCNTFDINDIFDTLSIEIQENNVKNHMDQSLYGIHQWKQQETENNLNKITDKDESGTDMELEGESESDID